MRRRLGLTALALIALTSVSAVASPAIRGSLPAPSVPNVLTVSGDHAGYVVVHVASDVHPLYEQTRVVRTGSYAGIITNWGRLLMTSDDVPARPAGSFYGGGPDLMRAGTYRVYLVTETGKFAVVKIPWDGPTLDLTPSTLVDHEFHALHGSLGHMTSSFNGSIAQSHGGVADRVWTAVDYDSRQPIDNDVKIELSITRRGGYATRVTGRGAASLGILSVGLSIFGDMRRVTVSATASSSDATVTAPLDDFTMWSLRLSLGRDLPRP